MTKKKSWIMWAIIWDNDENKPEIFEYRYLAENCARYEYNCRIRKVKVIEL